MNLHDAPPPPPHVRDPFANGAAAGDRGPVLGPFADDGQWPPQEPPENETPPDPEPRALILRPASEIRIRPVRWLWDTTPEGAPPTSHGRIPLYSLAIAAGGPGLGKSQFAVWLTARITRGELPGELYGKPRGVIYAATEDSWTYTIAPRLIAAGANLELVFRVEVKDDERPRARLTLPSDTSLIGQAAEMYSVALLVADPLLSLIDRGINDYRAAEVREALEPLVASAERHHFTILGLAHFTKSGGADPLARLAGSGAFGQLIRSFVAFAREDVEGGEERFVMSLEKNNLGRLGLPSYSYAIQPVTVETEDGPSYVSRFVLGPETSTSVRDVMRDEIAPSGDKAENDEVRMWLRNYLVDLGGAAESGDLMKDAEKHRYSRPSIYRAKTKLGLITRQSGFGKSKKSVWYLPEAAPAEEPDTSPVTP
ncbi:AAA family ATPase [Streptomyces phaeoluteigriseus]|uniref:AAA family ATPase n=1 Tax=Streptomyces phaeoluteigriseus TaxID=114686 RepID=UPI000AA04F33|nr:AAA family ATPase [Streptomyces phaeoluteigriseus]